MPFRGKRLIEENAGAVAPTVALSLFALIAAGGIAFDYARLAAMDTELQGAADQAALAAVTQLDGKDDAITRATSAAQSLISNETRFANDGRTRGIVAGTLTFYESYDQAGDSFGAETTDPTKARVVQVTVDGREAFYALTPVVGALRSGNITASAAAGMGSAVCKVPPIMICNPDPGTEFNANNSLRGVGVKVVGDPGNSLSPGNFGFLDVGAANFGAPDQLAALAYQNATLNCIGSSTSNVNTGVTASAFDAINTRFDIYNFGSGSGSTLGACYSGACPSAPNVVKDVVRPQNANGNNACKLHSSGWQLPTRQFSPKAYNASDSATTTYASGPVDAMGLPRDNCHYTSYGHACPSGGTDRRIGDGNWARQDYFTKYHSANKPSDWQTMTRYETYLWEQEPGNLPNDVAAGSTLRQYGAPQCSTGTRAADRDRRVMSVAIVENCAELSGTSRPAQISKWVDLFMVEPAVNRGNGVDDKTVYFEVIGDTKAAGNDSTGAQVIRRDVPYLIR